MAALPEAVSVKVHIEFDEDTLAALKQVIRDEIAMFAANTLTAAVDRRDGTGAWHRAHATDL